MGAFIFGSVYLWGSICAKFLMDLYKGGLNLKFYGMFKVG